MWVLYPLIFLAGFVDSIAGGGGLISLTSYIAVGLPAHLAMGTNKFSAVAGTGIAAARFAKKGYVDWKSAVTAFFGALVGSTVGAKVVLMLDERIVRYIMVVMVPLVAVFLIVRKDIGVQAKPLPDARVIPYALLVGVLIGMYDGFFGPGTGTFLIIAFTTLMGFDMMTACGNAKVVNFASNLAAMTTFIISGDIDYKLGIPCAICGIAGNYVGAELAIRKGTKIVRPMMLVVIGILLIKIVWDLVGKK